MTPAVFAFVAGAAVLGAALGATVLPWWADRESRSAARSGPRTRLAGALVTGVAFGLLALRVGVDAVLPAFLAVTAAGTAISIVDLREKRIPNRMLLVSAPVVAVLLAGGLLLRGEPERLLAVLAGAAAMFVLYFLIALIAPAAMGMGDVKLAALLGGALGAAGLTAWLGGLLAAYLIGGIVAVITLVAGRVGWRGSIPFGPWMVAGAVVGLAL
jgi:leader peptidase (prepilin peptidase)/N-methyltransferase